MEIAETSVASVPAEICGCAVERVLTDDQSYLAIGPGDRQVVLKKVDPDCLIGKALHPTVRDRLARVRELAHASVANLFGVEREGRDAYLMWEYVEGLRLDFYAGANRTPREIAAVAREMVLAVDLLHMQGIVHGALIGSNVVVTYGGAVRLTHISPLLFTDPGVDIECVWNLLDLAAEQLGDRGATLAGVIDEARARKMPLRQLATRLGPLIDARDAKKHADPEMTPTYGPRKRALIGAALTAVAGVVIAWAAWHAIEGGHFALSDRLHLPFHSQAEH